ncbi:hypothetical protein CFP56_029967 [Quercus suber]|uniref:Uncharacterized protein n=1 Tax=Quercus suber TaxID=58331 RepID=A0AAW0JP93_QUESU
MAGHSESSRAEKKSGEAANEIPTFNAENLQTNMKAIYYSRSCFSGRILSHTLRQLLVITWYLLMTWFTYSDGFIANLERKQSRDVAAAAACCDVSAYPGSLEIALIILSRKRASSGLKRIELDLNLHLGQNGAQSQSPSRPKWSSISASAQSIDDCEISLPLSFLINNGGSGFGYFVGVGLLADQWVW